MRALLQARGEQAFRVAVRKADDLRLERTFGTGPGLTAIFTAMRQAYVPEGAQGWRGEVQYDLRAADGRLRQWTVGVGPFRCDTRPGAATEPGLIVQTGVADFIRMAAGDLDVGSALLTGRLDLRGDVAVAMRLGEMFGQVDPGTFDGR